MRFVRESGGSQLGSVRFLSLGWGIGPLIAMATAAAGVPCINFFTEMQAKMFSHAISSSVNCSLDRVNQGAAQGAAIDHAGKVSFNGWVADIGSGKIPADFSLVLSGDRDYYVKGSTGRSRPDLVATWNNPALEKAGFHVTAYLANMPVGDYQVMIYYYMNGKTMACPTNDTISVQ
ncbi:MAG TPA: hypothetical protein VHA71_05125 [Rhodanobacteraceae bacterium]|jgi:hypothetical protein|nr:hypothetical protein [Rhodanobacteraceae bacterium]